MKNKFFLLSFIPALVYWYLEETQSIQIAVIGGVGLSLIEVTLEKVFTKHVHSLSKLNLAILCVLGPISLIGQDGIWFKLQSMFTGIFVFSYLIFNLRNGKSLFWKMMDDLNLPKKMPREMLVTIEGHVAWFMLSYGLFMGYLAIYQPTSVWAFFKTIGFYLAFGVLLFVEMFFLKKKLKKEISAAKMMEVIEKMRPE